MLRDRSIVLQIVRKWNDKLACSANHRDFHFRRNVYRFYNLEKLINRDLRKDLDSMKIDENSIELRRLVKNVLNMNGKRKKTNEWMGKEEAIVPIKNIYDNRIDYSALYLYCS